MYDYAPQKKQPGRGKSRHSLKQSENQCLSGIPVSRHAVPVIQRQLFSVNKGMSEITMENLKQYLALIHTIIRKVDPNIIQINSSNGSTREFNNIDDAMTFLLKNTCWAIQKDEVFHINWYVSETVFKIDFTKISSESAADQDPAPTTWRMSSTGLFPGYESKKRPPFYAEITDEITKYPTHYQNYPTSAGLQKSGLDQTHILSFGSAYSVMNSFMGNFLQMPEEERPHAVHSMKRLTASLGGRKVSGFVNEEMDGMFSDPLELRGGITRAVPKPPKHSEEALYPFTAMIANNPANVGFGSASENRGIRERFDPQQYAGTDTFSYQTQVIAENLRQLEGVAQDLITSSLEQRTSKSGVLRHSSDVEMKEFPCGTYEIDGLSDMQICDILEYGASYNSASVRQIIVTGSEKEAAVPIVRKTYIKVTIGPPDTGDCVSFTIRPISGDDQFVYYF